MSVPSERPCSQIACGLSDVGRHRTENQDQFLIAELRKSMLVQSASVPLESDSPLFGVARGQLLIVADGMGGHAAGGRASSIALDQLITQLLNRVHWFLQSDQDREEDFIDSLKELLQLAHARILAEAGRDDARRGMGTTLTMAYITWPRMYVAHAGDTRCYLVRQGRCEQLTSDHTLARQLVESGDLKPEEEAQSRWSNVLWNVLGGNGEQDLIAEVRRTDLHPGDTVFLCSDGLSRYLSNATLAEIVSEGCDDINSICHRLVGLANAAGGEDNITVVVCKPGPGEVNAHFLGPMGSPEKMPPQPCTGSPNHSEADDEADLSHSSSGGDMAPEDFDDEDTLPG